MSKLPVKLPSASRPATAKISVRSVLEQGQVVNATRCRSSPAPISVPCASPKPNPKLKDARVCKILWPPEPETPKCLHNRGLVLDRSAMSSKIHCSYLALPKKKIVRAWPRWVERKIRPSSARVIELAEPSALRVINNFDAHLNHLTIFQIENYLKKITKGDYETPEIALQMLKHSIHDRQMRVNQQRKEENKLRAKEAKNVKEIVCCVIKSFAPFILSPQHVELTEEAAKYSDVILTKICKLLKQNVPARSSGDILERVLCKIADKIAFCMVQFIENSNFKNPPVFNVSTCKDFSRKCQSIEEILQPVEKETAVDKPADGIEADEVVEDEIRTMNSINETQADEPDKRPSKVASNATPVVVERKLSFLRRSQINFEGLDCEEAAAKSAQRAAERSSKSAAKAQKKLVRQKAKKAKKAQQLASGVQDQGCYGQVDKKPQWQVEWVDRG